jgi:hypothetical protein
MNSLWFSNNESALMATPVMGRIRRAIKEGRTSDALYLCVLLKNERIVLHDFFADACTALFTWVSRNLGEDSLPAMFNSCFEKSARRQVLDLLALGLDRGIEAVMLARSCWIAHSCSGAGEHGGAFRLIEDDEKFTFELDPCGSGGRLWRRGRYDQPAGMAVTSGPHPWSYGRSGFPVYCVHCAFLNEMLPHAYLGHSSWPVDPPEHAGGICRWHIYKDPHAVPESYYARLSLKKNTHGAPKTVRQNREDAASLPMKSARSSPRRHPIACEKLYWKETSGTRCTCAAPWPMSSSSSTIYM